MRRWIKRLWFLLTHQHDYEVIFRFRHRYTATRGGTFHRNAILERCHCGHERAREWSVVLDMWLPLDLDWLNDTIARQGLELPARHPE